MAWPATMMDGFALGATLHAPAEDSGGGDPAEVEALVPELRDAARAHLHALRGEPGRARLASVVRLLPASASPSEVLRLPRRAQTLLAPELPASARPANLPRPRRRFRSPEGLVALLRRLAAAPPDPPVQTTRGRGRALLAGDSTIGLEGLGAEDAAAVLALRDLEAGETEPLPKALLRAAQRESGSAGGGSLAESLGRLAEGPTGRELAELEALGCRA